MDPAKYAALFAAESREHLQACNAQLLAWERAPTDLTPVRELFRSVHTLKGMAATLGFSRLAKLAHAFEHLLAGLRDGRVRPSRATPTLCFEVVDRLELGVTLALEGNDALLDTGPLLAGVARVAGTPEAPAVGGAVPAGPPPRAPGEAGTAIRIHLRPDLSMPAARAMLLLRQARSLGRVSRVTPPPEAWMEARFQGPVVFRLVSDRTDVELRQALLASGGGDVVEVEIGAGREALGERQVRVELGRLNRLVGLAGELVVARNRLVAFGQARREPELEAAVRPLARLVSELQEQVMGTRMAPVREVFERFPRPVRDLARELDKRVRLDLVGTEIELDRAILDQLADPLLHLLRNAVDHGIEGVAQREAAGKPVEGVITMSARRDRNTVVIEVSDDGRGVDEVAVRARAGGDGESGPGAGAGQEELLAILARPGFSTAPMVTPVSGRGVGIDVVMAWVRRLGGTTSLASEPGRGTTVALRLPLTVAIIPALLVGVQDQRYALPLGFVAETTRIMPSPDGGGASATYRGEPVPILEWLTPGDSSRPGRDWRPGVVLDVGGRQGALVVDVLLGQEDIVVGPLVSPRGTPAWVNGTTILADGRPAMIVDPGALVEGRP